VTHKTDQQHAPLFKRALGGDWHALPGPVRKMHDLSRRRIVTGAARVERGNNRLANLIADIFGFPPASPSVPVEVTFEPAGSGEIWTRRFGPATFLTHLDEARDGHGRSGLIVESFGPLSFTLNLSLDRKRLYLIPVAWSLYGLPLPMSLAPHGNSYEFAEDGKFAFHIEIAIPLAGLMVRYHGTLENPSG